MATSKLWIAVELRARGTIEIAELAHARLRSALADVEQVLDQHAEGRAPVADVVLPDHVVAEVLQSAEVMKAAVSHLEPHMEKKDGALRGKVVLATVKGDVHDIGKNLVDIILTNNGYTVHNIGIKQPIATIIEKAEEVGADAIGMSGLLVKSTVVMKENLQEMNSRGVAAKLEAARSKREQRRSGEQGQG